MASQFQLTDKDFEYNATLDPTAVLDRLGFTARSIYTEGQLIRVHCPIHQDLVRKSLILDANEKTFRCQYASCPAHEGGLLIELLAMYLQCDVSEVPERFGSESKASSDLVFRGEMLINQGRAREALPYFEQACRQNPRDEITRCKLAALYLELGMKDEAYQAYLRAAESYAVRGELENTLSIYNILIMLQPGAVKARKQLSVLFSRMGRPDAAVEQLKWVIDFYYQHEEIPQAIETSRQLLETDPENAVAHVILGRLLTKSGDPLEAAEAFVQGARLFVKARRKDDALEAIAEGIRITPGNPQLRELKQQADAIQPHETPPAPTKQDSAAAEQAFVSWLEDLEDEIEGKPAAKAAPAPPPQPSAPVPKPAPKPAAATPAPMQPPTAPAKTPQAPPPPVAKAVAAPTAPKAATPATSAAPPPPAKPVPAQRRDLVVDPANLTPPIKAPDLPAAPPKQGTPTPPQRITPATPAASAGAAASPRPATPAAPAKLAQPKPATPAPGIAAQTTPTVRQAPPKPAPAPAPVAKPPAPAPPQPAAQQAPAASTRRPHETVEILPSDLRVSMCMENLKDLSKEQIERMREQLIMMFNDVRRTYEEGLVSDWEMRSIKEFYKAFNVAVDQHLQGRATSSAPPRPTQ